MHTAPGLLKGFQTWIIIVLLWQRSQSQDFASNFTNLTMVEFSLVFNARTKECFLCVVLFCFSPLSPSCTNPSHVNISSCRNVRFSRSNKERYGWRERKVASNYGNRSSDCRILLSLFLLCNFVNIRAEHPVPPRPRPIYVWCPPMR